MVAVDSENLVDGLAPESDLAPHAAGNDLSASSSHRKHRSQWTSHALSHVLAIALVFFGADQVLLHVGGDGWLREGPVDELAHLLTGALVLAALRGGVDRRFAAGLLVMSVLIDVDHVPGLLGVDWITRGTDRPYTHSLLMLAVVGLAAVGWRRHRSLLLGALLGLGAHLARDLSESSSGVPLAWPLSLHSFTLPHWTYLLAMSAVLAVALWRAGAPWRRVLPVVLVVAGLTTAATAAASLPVRHSVAGQPPAQGGYTRLVWSDEFGGSAGAPPSASAWVHDVGAYGWTNHELQTYTAATANSARDGRGHLAIVARREIATGPDGRTRSYTSARLTTRGRFSTTHGRFEARMKIPAGRGLWPAFWMLGDDIDGVGWPGSGEIDVMEALGHDPKTVHGTLHGPGSGAAGELGSSFVAPRSLATDFHTYAVSWSPDAVTWLLDGKAYATVGPAIRQRGWSSIFNRPFHLLLNLAVGGTWPGSPDASTPLPATLLVDWVRVYG
jgi:beta-glucanase (GH16 family)